MKNIFFLVGVGVAGYGTYLYFKKRKSDCGCTEKTTTATIVKKTEAPLYPDTALEQFSTKWTNLFPSPERLGQGPLLLDDADTFSAQVFVSQ